MRNEKEGGIGRDWRDGEFFTSSEADPDKKPVGAETDDNSGLVGKKGMEQASESTES
jgi:hypothetical protein